MVNLGYYRQYFDPNASLKDYYLSRLEAHKDRCVKKSGPDWKNWPMSYRVEMARCKLILEAIKEKEERDG